MNQEHYAPPKSELEITSKNDGSNRIRLHSQSAIGIATFFGGPFAAGYLVYRNYVRLGLRSKANQVFGWFSAGGLVSLYATWKTPPDFISFMLMVGLPQLVAVLVVSQILQGRAIATHRSAGGAIASNWFALVVAIAGNILVTAAVYVLSYVQE